MFPLFIFIMGVAIVLSLPRLVEREGRAKAHWRVLRRALLLYGLGLIYYGGMKHGWHDIRFLGILQRIAICYLFAALLFLNFNLRGLIATFVALLVGYWALMTFVPVPGIGAGHFGPDQNLANWIDAQLSARPAVGQDARPGRAVEHAAGDRHLPARRVRRHAVARHPGEAGT